MSVTTTSASFTDFEKACVQLAGVVYSKTDPNKTALPTGWSLGRYVSDHAADGNANQDFMFSGGVFSDGTGNVVVSLTGTNQPLLDFPQANIPMGIKGVESKGHNQRGQSNFLLNSIYL